MLQVDAMDPASKKRGGLILASRFPILGYVSPLHSNYI